jgi:hypothetical protein
VPTRLCIAAFVLENLDDGPEVRPPLAERIGVLLRGAVTDTGSAVHDAR